MHLTGTKRIPSFETLLLGCVCLVGLLVIVGWHLEIRALVQIIPGAIAMQYNTALCFVILAATSIAARYSKRFVLPMAVAFGAVGLMGWLVVFQYLADTSLGIDTLFFVPWESTLSAHPGRMALTSAFSFGIVGSTAAVYALYRRALVLLALGLIFPLSFGLTSLLGYVIGITYVLPFRLGSQMAVHTAASFTLFSVAILAALWRSLPESREGLPKWSPGIAVVAAPILFIGLSSVMHGNTLVSNTGRIVLAVAGTGVLAFLIHRLIDARVIYKGAILTAVPLLFVLAFVLLVSEQKESTTKAQEWESHSKEVIETGGSVLERLATAESNVRAYLITDDRRHLGPFENAADEATERLSSLQGLVADNPLQLSRTEALGTHAAERLAALRELADLMARGDKATAVSLVKDGSGSRAMDAFRLEMDQFLAEEGKLNSQRRSDLQESWQRFDWLLVSGAAADLLLAVTLAFLFTRGIARRLETVSQNANALGEGKSLARPMAGSDEIAQLDQVFHKMATALTEAHENLEAKVEERTRELAEASAEIRELNESLERRISERTYQLETANKELEAFSYSVSHDLRAPLRAIDGFARIFEEDYTQSLDSEGVRLLGVIRANAQNMGQLIDDLLAFSRMGRKQIEPVAIDMTEVAVSVADELKASGSASSCSFSIGQLPCTFGDKALIRQVLVNLISNAVKYSRPKENSRIEVGARVESSEFVYHVRDNGVGFDMNYSDKLFGVFQRLHRPDEFEGTGVGLAIVQRIVHRHGGRVWAESEIANGATFYFSLPKTDTNQG